MNLEDQLRLLEMRVSEIEAVANDSLDLTLAAPLPNVRLTPPATPQQEVFGGSGSGIFPGPLQIESTEDGLYLVQKWCKAKGTMYQFVTLTKDDTNNLKDASGNQIAYTTLGGPGCTTEYATRIRLFTHAEDHSEGLIQPWTDETATT